jgi:serine phosphatase RsbU (regulator of sigma subunit)
MEHTEHGTRLLDRWVEAMRRGALLGALDPDILRDLLDRADVVVVEAGEVLIRQGEAGDCAYVVLDGVLEVVVETPAGEVAMATLGPQQIVGEIAVFTDLPRTATVRATSDAALMRLGRADLAASIAAHPETAFGLLAALGRRVNSLNRPLAMLTLAAQALERGDLDADALAELVAGGGEVGPFARSFRNLVHEMESKHAYRQEMAVAARLQQAILPRRLDFAAVGAPYAVDAFMRAARDVGGDFYDYFLTGDGRAILVVADVSGKGVPASLFMAISRTLIRSSVLGTASIAEGLERANALLEAENPECLFVTVFLAEIDLARHRLTYVNAGHCDGYVLGGGGGGLTVLPPTGPAVAMLPKPRFRAETVDLAPGDLLFVVSDGVTEAFATDGGLFGEERLMAVLRGLARPSAAEALAAVEAAVNAFAAGCEQSDDITCLALARL